MASNPRFPLSAPELVAHTHVLCLLGSARPRGEYKVFCTGGVTPLSEDARVETANVKGKALHHNSCSLIHSFIASRLDLSPFFINMTDEE
jgi:hypothetical protein